MNHKIMICRYRRQPKYKNRCTEHRNCQLEFIIMLINFNILYFSLNTNVKIQPRMLCAIISCLA